MGFIGDVLTGAGEGLQQVDVLGARNRIDSQAQLKIENERAGRQEESQKAQATLGTLMTVLGATPEVRSQMANSDEAKSILESMGLGENLLSSVVKLGDQNVKFLLNHIKDNSSVNPEEFLKQLTGQLSGRPITEQLAIIDPILKRGKAREGRKELERLVGEGSRQEQAVTEDAAVEEQFTPPVTSLAQPQQETKPQAQTGSAKILQKKLDTRRKSIEKDFALIEKIEKNPKITDEQKANKIDSINKKIERKQAGLTSLVSQLKNEQAATTTRNKPRKRVDVIGSEDFQQGLKVFNDGLNLFDSSTSANPKIRLGGQEFTREQWVRAFKSTSDYAVVGRDIDIIADKDVLTEEERQAKMFQLLERSL